MQFASLGSGSRGNATLVRADSTTLMIDLGFSLKETERRLARLGLTPTDIDAVLVTHEHTDHVQGVVRFAKRHDVAVWATSGTQQSNKLDGIEVNLIDTHCAFQIADIQIQPFPVPHDAKEPCQFVFEHQGLRLGLLTDIGSLTHHVVETLSGVHGLLLECNHDYDMLMQGSYSYSLKQRVAGDFGHLNNRQSAQLLETMDTRQLQCLVAMHLSEKNNDENIVYQCLSQVLAENSGIIEIADQEQGLAWRRLKPELMSV